MSTTTQETMMSFFHQSSLYTYFQTYDLAFLCGCDSSFNPEAIKKSAKIPYPCVAIRLPACASSLSESDFVKCIRDKVAFIYAHSESWEMQNLLFDTRVKDVSTLTYQERIRQLAKRAMLQNISPKIPYSVIKPITFPQETWLCYDGIGGFNVSSQQWQELPPGFVFSRSALNPDASKKLLSELLFKFFQQSRQHFHAHNPFTVFVVASAKTENALRQEIMELIHPFKNGLHLELIRV